MTTKTTQHASRTIASTLADMLGLADELAQAHGALDLPGADDVTVDWQRVIACVDALGEASQRLALAVHEQFHPILKAVKAHAQAALAEIATLNSLAEARPRA